MLAIGQLQAFDMKLRNGPTKRIRTVPGNGRAIYTMQLGTPVEMPEVETSPHGMVAAQRRPP